MRLLLALGVLLTATNASAQTLHIQYNEGFDGTVSINGEQIGKLLPIREYNRIKEEQKNANPPVSFEDRDKPFIEYTGADDAGLNGMASSTTMDFEVEFELAEYLKEGENTITIDLTKAELPENYGFFGSSKRLNKLEASVWNAKNLDMYKQVVLKPTDESQFGTVLSSTATPVTLTITK